MRELAVMLKQQVDSFFIIIPVRVFTSTVTAFIIERYINTFAMAILAPSKNTMDVLTNKFLLPSTTANTRLAQAGIMWFNQL